MKKLLAWIKAWWTELTYRWTVKEFGHRSPVEVWSAPVDQPQVTGLCVGKDGLFLCASGSFRGKGYSSEIWLRDKNGGMREVHSGRFETIASGVEDGSKVHFCVERGSNPREGDHSLVWDGGGIRKGPATKGRYGVAGGRAGGKVLLAYNDSYAKWMHDRPKLVDANSGKVVKELPNKGFCRAVWDYMGGIGAAISYSSNPHLYLAGKIVQTRMMKAASRGRTVYGGGGVFAGPEGKSDGGIYKWDGKESEIGRVSGQSCEAVWSDGKRILLGFINPDCIVEINAKGKPSIVYEWWPDSRYTRGWAFGIAITVWDNKIWVARSENSRVRLYRMD